VRGLVTRRRAALAGLVVAVVAAIAVIGVLSRSTSDTAVTTPAAAAATTGGTAPSALWYWTMAVAPSDPRTLVLGTSSGLYRSTDGGKTWQPTGPRNADMTSVVTAGSTMLAGGVAATPTANPVIRVGAARSASNGPAVLAASTDGGATWTTLHPAGLPDVSVQAIAVDPTRSSTVYLLTNTGRFYRSTDGARSFRLLSTRLGIPPWALAVTQNSHFLGGDMDSGAHQSANGTAWQTSAYTDARGTHMVMEYAVQPSDATRILMTSIGVVISTDGGRSWRPALRSTVMFGPVAWASSAPDTAYAIGFDGSTWHSGDGGATWTRVP
jgi:photosystem II stability/assembly factor-like uncharacterized protein